MSDLNFNYNTLQNLSASQRQDFTLSNVKPSKDDDLNLNQSIFKAYLETLKEKSDEATKKTLQELQNTPISAVGRLFGNLQVNSVEQVSKIFDDLRIKPTDEIDTILGAMQTRVTEQTGKTLSAKQAEKAADKTAKEDSITEKTQENEDKDTFLTKFLKHSTDKMSKENDELNKRADEMSASAASLKQAIKRDDETGERNAKEMDRAAEDFVSRYNTFADTVNNSKNETVNGKAKLITDMLDAYGRRLEKVGITKDEDGKLSLDKKKLEAASDKDLERAFGDEDSFTDFIEGQSKQLQSYAQTDLYQNASAYNDGGNITQVSNISGSYFNMLG